MSSMKKDALKTMNMIQKPMAYLHSSHSDTHSIPVHAQHEAKASQRAHCKVNRSQQG